MNRERVQMLRDMIAGIPASRINLQDVFRGSRTGTEKPPPTPCGAVACMAGWAWIYPPFVRAGIRSGGKYSSYYPCEAAERFFDTLNDDQHLFDPRWCHETGTHKQIALKRLDALLKG